MDKLIDKSKLIVGCKLLIWSDNFNKDVKVTITFKRLNVIFFTFDDYPNQEEDWLPTGCVIVEKAQIL